MIYISNSIKHRTICLIANDKWLRNSRGYYLPMSDLGKFKEVTAFLKLSPQFSEKTEVARI